MHISDLFSIILSMKLFMLMKNNVFHKHAKFHWSSNGKTWEIWIWNFPDQNLYTLCKSFLHWFFLSSPTVLVLIRWHNEIQYLIFICINWDTLFLPIPTNLLFKPHQPCFTGLRISVHNENVFWPILSFCYQTSFLFVIIHLNHLLKTILKMVNTKGLECEVRIFVFGICTLETLC